MTSLNKPRDRAEIIYKNLNEIIEKNHNGLNEKLNWFVGSVTPIIFVSATLFAVMLGSIIFLHLSQIHKFSNPALFNILCVSSLFLIVFLLSLISIFLVDNFYKYHNFDTKKYRDDQKRISWFIKGLASLIIFSIILRSIIENFFSLK